VWSARAHEVEIMCSGVKPTLTSGGKCERINSTILKCTPTLGFAVLNV